MDVYSINPNAAQQAQDAQKERRRLSNILVVLVVIAIIVGLLYWWTASVNKQPASTSSNAADMRAQVAAVLRNAPIYASQQEIESVAAQLKSSNTPVDDTMKMAVANALKR